MIPFQKGSKRSKFFQKGISVEESKQEITKVVSLVKKGRKPAIHRIFLQYVLKFEQIYFTTFLGKWGQTM